MSTDNLSALEELKSQYGLIDKKFKKDIENAEGIITYHWPGSPNQDIMLIVHQSFGITEPFHIHDYFHFLYAYKGSIEMLGKDQTVIKLKEGDLYAGQPHTGHAFKAHDDDKSILIGLIIQKSAFYREFMNSISTDSNFFHFLIDHVEDLTSSKYMHLNLSKNQTVRDLMRIMVREFANPRNNTAEMLKSLVVSFLLEVSREYSRYYPQDFNPAMRILNYMDAHLSSVTLKETAQQFGYHPNYLSTFLKKEVGKSFSNILTELRMHRSMVLLKDSNLSITEIAKSIGYIKPETFRRIFKEFYGKKPEEFVEVKEN